MLDCGREDLLFHPLTREIVRLKWYVYRLTIIVVLPYGIYKYN